VKERVFVEKFPRWARRKVSFPRRRTLETPGTLRPASFRFVNAGRCVACYKPIIFTVVAGQAPKLVAVEAQTWDGSVFYIRGKHQNHIQHCSTFIKKMKDWRDFRETDLYVESDEEVLRKVEKP